nr:RecName: Full=Toxin Plt [Parabuthus liosoma]
LCEKFKVQRLVELNCVD